MYRKMLLALVTALFGAALLGTPARAANPPWIPCVSDKGACFKVPLTLGKKYHMTYQLGGPMEEPPAVIDGITAGTAELAEPQPMPWQEAALADFRAAATALGPGRVVFVGVVVVESDPSEPVITLLDQAGASIAAGLVWLGDGLADPDHAEIYDALALESFANARQAFAAVLQSGG